MRRSSPKAIPRLWRGAIAQCFEKEAKLCLEFFGLEIQLLENFLLQFAIVDPLRSPSDLIPV